MKETLKIKYRVYCDDVLMFYEIILEDMHNGVY